MYVSDFTYGLSHTQLDQPYTEYSGANSKVEVIVFSVGAIQVLTESAKPECINKINGRHRCPISDKTWNCLDAMLGRFKPLNSIIVAVDTLATQ